MFNLDKTGALALFLNFLMPPAVSADTVEYSFDIDYKNVNFTGETVQAMSVGGSIPAPTIEATVGDILRVTLTNKMAVESSVHWHGILLPNDQDGVPYLTTPPIQPGTSFTFEYPVIHHGTYWYHSHTGLQEQRGVYGSIVFHPAEGELVAADHDVVVVLSDWTDENPNRVMHNLKKSDDYYALKKGSVQSWFNVVRHGRQVIANRLEGAWMRMGPMDISDVGYDAFLANGEKVHRLPGIRAGETVRLRLINAGASSYFNVEFADGPMTILAADGVDVEPQPVDRLRLAIAETFDVIVTLPEDGAYEFRATAEDGTGYASVMLGDGPVNHANDIPPPNPYLMDHGHHGGGHRMTHEALPDPADNEDMHRGHAMTSSGHSHGSHVAGAGPERMQEYELLRSRQPTNFDGSNPRRVVRLELTGDMERYAWSFNNKVLSEDSQIMIRRGETVQFVLDNKTMMHHPLHLHGHFFRVLNGQGEYSPLKHTVNVPPLQSVTIEFFADQEKDWFFHCHNLYHMKSGMARVISYAGSSTTTRDSLSPLFADRQWFYFADIGVQTNFASGELRAESTRHALDLEFDWDYEDEYEVEVAYERSLTRFLEVYAGAEVEKEDDERESIGVLGLTYVLPLLIDADLRVDTDGRARLGLASELQLTDRASFHWMVNTDSEYRLELDYEVNKRISITGNHDDHYDWGVGIKFKF